VKRLTRTVEVGGDLFVDWYGQPEESGFAYRYADVEVISETEYDERVKRMDSGRPAM
jgi:hypothetical protein